MKAEADPEHIESLRSAMPFCTWCSSDEDSTPPRTQHLPGSPFFGECDATLRDDGATAFGVTDCMATVPQPSVSQTAEPREEIVAAEAQSFALAVPEVPESSTRAVVPEAKGLAIAFGSEPPHLDARLAWDHRENAQRFDNWIKESKLAHDLASKPQLGEELQASGQMKGMWSQGGPKYHAGTTEWSQGGPKFHAGTTE